MKRLLPILFFFLLITQNGFSQWIKQNSGTTLTLHSVYATSSDCAWVVGGDGGGIIMRTTNGGTNWISLTTVSDVNLNGVCFTDSRNGTIVGGIGGADGMGSHYDHGIILRTTDGGETWTIQSTEDTDYLIAVTFVDSLNGWAVGGSSHSGRGLYSSGAVILHTSNGGNIWTVQHSDSSTLKFIECTSVIFSDISTGMVLGADGTILRTSDGGANWTSQTIDINQGEGITCSTIANNGIVFGIVHDSLYLDNPIILRTSDEGDNWTSQAFDTWVYSAFFIDSNTGIVVGRKYDRVGNLYTEPVILFTNDCGETWVKQISGTTSPLYGVYFIDANTGWAVGENGTILHTTNGGVTFFEHEQFNIIPTEYILKQNYPNPFNPSTTIKYSIPKQSNVTLKVYDLLGEQIAKLVNKEQPHGNYEIEFDGSDLTSGIYFYKILAGEFTETKKMILMK